jgi:hypothetical protein
MRSPAIDLVALENRGGKWLIVFHQETIAK